MKPVLDKVLQVGIVVRDAAKTAKIYADKYGIGPWYFYGKSFFSDLETDGEPSDFSYDIAFAYIGDTEIELIEPLDDKGIYAQFLAEHGEGIHHLGFNTPNFDKTMDFFKENNTDIMCSGVFCANEKFVYADTRDDLALIAEFFYRKPGDKNDAPEKIYPSEE